MEKVIENLKKENEGLKAMLKETELALKNCVLHSVSNICQCSNPVFKTYEYTNKPVCTKCRKL